MKDWTNIGAMLGAVVVATAVVVCKPDGTALALAGTVIGGCLAILQRRDVP